MLLLIIGGIQKTTLIDFPQKIAAIVFTQGCNFSCGYCHNPELLGVQNKSNRQNTEDFFKFLDKRKGKLDGVVITGGEPTLQSGLYEFIRKIKTMDFAVKLDTNGSNPQILQKLIEDSLLDYVAMDIKAPFDKYSQITGVNVNINNILRSINLITKNNIDYEFRTTVIKSQLNIEDFEKIGQLINGAKKYYLQKFIPTKILDKKLLKEYTYSNEEFEIICAMLKKYVKYVSYR